MNHEEAWARLPDLLDDRDDAALLAHVRDCADCQRQLFLLGRVDRLLRERAEARRPPRRLRRMGLVAATAAAAAAAALLALFLPGQGSSARAFTLRSPEGQNVGKAQIGRSDGNNFALAFTAHGLPVNRTHMLVLWARAGGAPMEVGEFMVDARGGCRVHFNLPATPGWTRFWVAQPGNATAVVASTD